MKLAVAVLSSILLACSITIANPIDPSESTDVEASTSTVIPSATISTEASIFPDLPSATTDVEASTSTVIPSTTISTEASIFPDLPSATTDVESIAFPDLPSATTDVESSIFPDLPSATTDVESSIFPDLPSATTSTEASIFPDLPSATTSTEASTSPTPNPNGIGLGGLDPLPDSIKELLEKYEKKKQNRIEQKKICELLRFQYDDQHKHVKDLKRKLYLLEHKSQGNGDGPKYDSEIQETKLDFEARKAKLEDLKKSIQDCDSKYKVIKFKLYLIEIEFVKLVFGGPWDPKSFERKLDRISAYPSVRGYFDGSGSKGQSSECNECLGQKPSGQRKHRKPSGQQQQQKPSGQQQHQNPSGQQQHRKPSGQQQHQKPSGQQQHQKPSGQQRQDPQPSSSRPSGSGSPGQGAPSNRRNGFSKLMHNVGSFFGRPK